MTVGALNLQTEWPVILFLAVSACKPNNMNFLWPQALKAKIVEPVSRNSGSNIIDLYAENVGLQAIPFKTKIESLIQALFERVLRFPDLKIRA